MFEAHFAEQEQERPCCHGAKKVEEYVSEGDFFCVHDVVDLGTRSSVCCWEGGEWCGVNLRFC